MDAYFQSPYRSWSQSRKSNLRISPEKTQPPSTYKQAPSSEEIHRIKLHFKKQLTIAIIIALTVATLLITLSALLVLFLPKDCENTASVTRRSFPGTATKEGVFTEDLKNPQSAAYKQIEKEFCDEMDLTMKNSSLKNDYDRCTVTSMRNGSIIIIFIIDMQTAECDVEPVRNTLADILKNMPISTALDSNCSAPDEDDCESSPCSNGATCYDLPEGYVCKCTAGYHGTNCELTTEMPTCAAWTTATPDCGTPCPSCPEKPTAASETCSTEAPGQDYCLGDPCKNSGTCYSISGDYLCVCDSQWTGKNCTEASVSRMRFPGTATNEGVYTEDLNNSQSAAYKQIEKEFCDEINSMMNTSSLKNDYDGCVVNNFRNGSIIIVFYINIRILVCSEVINVYNSLTNIIMSANLSTSITLDPIDRILTAYGCPSCLEITTVVRQTCPTLSSEPDYCADNPCKNNGTCHNITDDYLCVCVNQWTGENCTEEMPTAAPETCPTLSPEPDYCSGNPCKNNGICYNVTDDYLCVCVNQWTGKNCSEDARLCSSESCSNNGTCYENDHGFYCHCDVGWTGQNCSQAVECPAPGQGVDATLQTPDRPYTYLYIANYTCDNAAAEVTSGNLTLQCLGTGQWSDSPPTCRLDRCAGSPCSYGTCYGNDNGFICNCGGNSWENQCV